MLDVTETKEKFAEFILPRDYVSFSPLTAEILLNGNQRGMAIDRTFLTGLQRYLQTQFQDRYTRILYEVGFAWGGQAYAQIEAMALTVFPEVRNIKELNMNRFHQLFTNHLSSMGWGNFELKRRDNFLFVDLYDSLYVDVLKNEPIWGGTGKPYTVCHLYAGFFAGIFSRISNMDLACLEITCMIDGYENCSFLLDNADTVRKIGARVQSGLAPLEAFQKAKREIEEQYVD
jgi:hypothetical protein